jgi:hypothetical protein
MRFTDEHIRADITMVLTCRVRFEGMLGIDVLAAFIRKSLQSPPRSDGSVMVC